MKKLFILSLALILTLSLAACDDGGSNISGGGLGDITVGGGSTSVLGQTESPNGNLSADEQALVGVYSYGKVPDGLYEAWKSSGTVDYEKWNSSLPLDMRIYVFNADGTFSSIEYYYSGNQNAFAFNKLIYTKANWNVTGKGTIQFMNIKETVDDFMAPGDSYKDKNYANRNEYYMQDIYNGKKGIRVNSYSLDEAKEADLYVMMD